jgi:hypothetical protein
MKKDPIEIDDEMEEFPPAEQEVAKAHQLFLGDGSFSEINDLIWFGCRFHTTEPIYVPGSLSLAFDLYDKFKDTNPKEVVPHCMLLLGRIFNAKGEFLPACRFFLCAQKLFKDSHWIIAMEFFREELRTPEAMSQIGLSREEFRKKYKKDTPQALVEQYRHSVP